MGSSSSSKSGRCEQHLAQGHAAALAAGQLGHVRVRRRQAQGIHGDLQRAIDIPALGRVDGVLQLGLLLQQLLHLVGRDVLAELRVDLVEAQQQLLHRRHGFLDVAEHRLAGIESRLLRQVPDA